MNNLTEAYHSVYQLDEVRFTSGLAQGTGSGSFNPTALTLPEKPKPEVKTPPTSTPAASPTPAAKKPPVPMGKTAAGTSYEIRTPTGTELKAAQAARKDALASGASRPDAEEAAAKAGVAAGKPSVSQSSPTTTPTSQATQDAIKSLDQDKKAKPFDTSKMTTKRETFNYGGEMEQEQLQSLLAAYAEMYKEPEEIEETEEDIQEKTKDDPCWKGYTQVGMKKKGGREVPNCVPSKGVPDAKGYKKEEVEQIDEVAPLVVGGLALGGAALAAGAIKRAQDAAKSGVDAAKRGQQVRPGIGIGNAAYGMQKRNQALNTAMQQLRQSYEPDAYDVILEYLMSEGLASTVENAEKIMEVMSEEKIKEIVALYM